MMGCSSLHTETWGNAGVYSQPYGLWALAVTASLRRLCKKPGIYVWDFYYRNISKEYFTTGNDYTTEARCLVNV